MQMQILIPDDPIPKARHRSAIVGGKIFIYDSQKNEKEKIRRFITKEIHEMQNGDRNYYGLSKELQDVLSADYFEVDMIFYMPIPKNVSKIRKKMMQENILKHDCKPDIDNLVKWILDCGNTIIWSDDKKVIKISAEKRYSIYTPHTQINITGVMKNVG